MIDRYTPPEMRALWDAQHKYATWLKIELAVLAAQEQLGLVPSGTHAQVCAKAQFESFDIQRIDALDETLKHDVIAFLTYINDCIDDPGLSRYLHLGLTSSDLVDTALSLWMQDAGALILAEADVLKAAIAEQAQTHLHTACIGRSHGIHGEPTTFGLKLLNWQDELERQTARFKTALQEARVGQMTGAVGTYAHNPPEVEALACQQLGLNPARITSQVIGRDRHAAYILALAQLASSIERWAIEIRHLQRTEVLEVEEPFAKGQKGSSAMPHKRNPVGSENLTGLARLIRGYAMPAMENIALWHERDISHSSVERVMIPDATTLMHYMLRRLSRIVRDLQVHPQNMARNLNSHGGIVFSQRVLLALVNAGLSREAAYALVQKNAMAIWNTQGGDFKAKISADPEVLAALGAEGLEACFDAAPMLAHVDTIAARF
ncbi:MAG: adenylosuccinate lyase [Vampirovibrionales bacterium]|nr:adenylosuccinate lyase [Vampirovibrionales bacterium]